MRVSRRAIRLIQEFEGFPNGGRPYNDPANFSTVGYGHLIARRPVNAADRRAVWVRGQSTPGQLSKREAGRLLKRDLNERFVPSVRRVAQIAPLNQNQFDATASFIFNLGPGVLDSGRSFGDALRRRDYRGAADSMRLYINPGTSFEVGLRRRREAERKLFLEPALTPEERRLAGWRERLGRVRAKAAAREAAGLVKWPPGLKALADRLKANIRAHTRPG